MEGDRDMHSQFQDWCLRTYGDSGKTKTVTRRKYERIVQLLNGSESNSSDNAKFKFWVKSKGFQLGVPDISGEKQVLYVPVKTTDGVGMDEKVSLKQVAVVEQFFDIIYSMHVERGINGEKTRKHAGQKRTYKAISETYAFLPREAVTRFLMSCSECQKRMHLNPDGGEHKENGKPSTLITSIIDYNLPITMAYMKQMKLQLINSHNDEEDSSVDSHEFDMSDSASSRRVSAVNSDLSSNMDDRMSSPQTQQAQQDEDSVLDKSTDNENTPTAAQANDCQENTGGNCKAAVGEQHEQPLTIRDCPLVVTHHTESQDHNGSDKCNTIPPEDQNNEPKEKTSKSSSHEHCSYNPGKDEGEGVLASSLSQGAEDNGDGDENHNDQDNYKSMESGSLQAEQLKAFDLQPTPSLLSTLAADNNLGPAYESKNGNGAKRMRLDRSQDEDVSNEKLCIEEKGPAESTTQEVLYINGPTDLSVKKQAAPSTGTSNNCSLQPQLNSTEINTVRQLIAGYRESAAFLLRSADELESLILQQN